MARDLAKKLGYRYIDTGAMYRAVTLYFLRNQIDFMHKDVVERALQDIKLNFEFDDIEKTQNVLLNNENVENEIRINPRVASVVSDISSISEVRKYLVLQQQEMGKEKGIVMDGRDIGTVVFPNAEVKLFITAKPQIRASRRFDELVSKGQKTTYEEVLANLEKRDYIDSTRADSPLSKAQDAIEIDNSEICKQEQLNMILHIVNKELALQA